MDLTRLRHFLLTLPGATEDTPFGPEILVYRIAGKMFALVDWQAEPLTINLKCEPELALLLREITPRGQAGLAYEQVTVSIQHASILSKMNSVLCGFKRYSASLIYHVFPCTEIKR